MCSLCAVGGTVCHFLVFVLHRVVGGAGGGGGGRGGSTFAQQAGGVGGGMQISVGNAPFAGMGGAMERGGIAPASASSEFDFPAGSS
jgi:hypothetical protein